MSEENGRNHSLDLIRGLAAITIAIYHYINWEFDFKIQSMGTFGVYIFFVLSSLTMMMIYGEQFSRSINIELIKKFYINRCARIFPLLLVASFINLILSCFLKTGGFFYLVAKWGLTATTLFGLGIPGYISNTEGAWSIGIEIFFYSLFPMVALLVMNMRFKAILFLCFMLIIAQNAYLLILNSSWANGSAEAWNYYTTPLMFSSFFALGIVIFKSNLKKYAVSFYVSILIYLLSIEYSLVLTDNLLIHCGHYFILTCMLSFAVFLSHYSQTPYKFISICNYLGNISYSLYLTHCFSHDISRAISKRAHLSEWEHFFTYCFLSFFLASISFYFLEKPAKNYIRSLTLK